MIKKFYFCYKNDNKSLIVFNENNWFVYKNNIYKNKIDKIKGSITKDNNTIYISSNNWLVMDVFSNIDIIELVEDDNNTTNIIAENELDLEEAFLQNYIDINEYIKDQGLLTFLAKELQLNCWRLDLLYKNQEDDFVIVELKTRELKPKDIDQALRYVEEIENIYWKKSYGYVLWTFFDSETYNYSLKKGITILSINN